MMRKRKFKPNIVKHVPNKEPKFECKPEPDSKSNNKQEINPNNGKYIPKTLIESKGIFDRGLHVDKKINNEKTHTLTNSTHNSSKTESQHTTIRSDDTTDVSNGSHSNLRPIIMDTDKKYIEIDSDCKLRTTNPHQIAILEKLLSKVDINDNQDATIKFPPENVKSQPTTSPASVFTDFCKLNTNKRFMHITCPKNMPWDLVVPKQRLNDDFPHYIKLTQPQLHVPVETAKTDLNKGPVGKIRLYKSGKVEMIIGDNVFQVANCTSTGSKKMLISYNKGESKLNVLGKVFNQSFKVIPKIEIL